MTKEIEEVNKEIKQVLNKNKRELETALIKPIHPKHQFSSNGLYLFFGMNLTLIGVFILSLNAKTVLSNPFEVEQNTIRL